MDIIGTSLEFYADMLDNSKVHVVDINQIGRYSINKKYHLVC